MNSPSSPAVSRIKLLAVMEPKTVTGAAKNMLDFCHSARELGGRLADLAIVETSIVTFERGSRQVGALMHAPGNSDKEGDQSPNEFVATARESGLQVDIIPERSRFDLRVIPALREIVKARAPDIILTHHVKSHLVMRLSRLWKEYPWVAFHHGYTRTQRRERIYNRMDRLSLPRADRVVTVCEAFARELARAGVSSERIHVQHNSIRPEEMDGSYEPEGLRERLGIPKNSSLVLSVGRLSSEKGHADLLAAFKHLRDAYADLRTTLIIVGDGPERERLETLSRSYGIAENVIFAGQISDPRSYYAAANLFVLPSHSEGSPYVLLEAMAAKLPIVATTVGGVPEMVEDGESALLVPARDSKAMGAATARLLTDAGLARTLTGSAAQLVATRFGPEAQVRSLIELYRAVLTKRVRSG